jgi:hypothetical protein
MLAYDFAIVVVFSVLTVIVSKAKESVLCGMCFTNTYGVKVNFFLGLCIILGLCFINHLKNKKNLAFKWYMFILYVFIAVIIFALFNVGIEIIAAVLSIGSSSSASF